MGPKKDFMWCAAEIVSATPKPNEMNLFVTNKRKQMTFPSTTSGTRLFFVMGFPESFTFVHMNKPDTL